MISVELVKVINFRTFLAIFFEKPEAKIEPQGTHTTFLDIDITIEDGMFPKKR